MSEYPKDEDSQELGQPGLSVDDFVAAALDRRVEVDTRATAAGAGMRLFQLLVPQELYERLRARVGPRGMSAFVRAAVEEKLARDNL